jgi:hypothetical protein
MPDGLHQANIALEQIRAAALDGRGPDQSEAAGIPFGFGLRGAAK